MGFGILHVSTPLLRQVYEKRQGEADAGRDPGLELDILHNVLMLPESFTAAEGPFSVTAFGPDDLVWVVRSDDIPTLPDESRLPLIEPIYSLHTEPDGHRYVTLDGVEVRSKRDWRLLASIACGVRFPAPEVTDQSGVSIDL